MTMQILLIGIGMIVATIAQVALYTLLDDGLLTRNGLLLGTFISGIGSMLITSGVFYEEPK